MSFQGAAFAASLCFQTISGCRSVYTDISILLLLAHFAFPSGRDLTNVVDGINRRVEDLARHDQICLVTRMGSFSSPIGGGEERCWKRSVMVESGRESKMTMTSLSKPHQLQLPKPYRPRLKLLHIHLAHAPKLRACHSVGNRTFCSHIPFTDTSNR